ncbi:type VI secretion system baseplate subunit TssG [Enterobacteriaceae bacterium 4M9]|nr:type VI secretion system baseplate subunit TssG [Enterobacteriaceae bacterium 4M9]
MPVMAKSIPCVDVWYDEAQPWNAGFVSVMRAISARTPDAPSPGTASHPRQEAFQIGQYPHMMFSPREISQIVQQNDKTCIQLYSLGVWGPQGAMPLHLTEQAYNRAEFNDTAQMDFVDLFHHRALSLFYRAWFVSQDTASLDRHGDEIFSFYISSIMGMRAEDLSDEILPLHPRLAASSHLVREARNPEGLVGALRFYFNTEVTLHEYVNHWIILQDGDCTQIGASDGNQLLGDGAILGNATADRQHKFRLTFGPLTLSQYMGFSPWGNDLPVLREWVRQFVGFEFAWEVSLLLCAQEVPPTILGEGTQLGYTTWLERADNREPVSGMTFEPEIQCYSSRNVPPRSDRKNDE